jgi:uncharacterized repeat protein (TIGR01451 family)
VAATAALVVFTVVGIGSAAGATSSRSALVKSPVTSHISFLAVPTIGTVGTAAGFEDNDGDLTPNNASPQLHDWNDFTPTWVVGTSPAYQTGSGTGAGGFTFFGITDDAATTSDTGFAGGVKQDDECPAVIGTKSPNKDDLLRAYIAGKLAADGHTYLMISWIRIPQNNQSADAHVAFEFNQGDTPCGSGSTLFHRTAGDLLVIYDFTNGGTPTISIERWVTSGSCQVGSDSPPCWGTEQTLDASVAEAKVNTDSTVTDTVLPGGGPATLGKIEFGEAGIDLTQAVFNLTGSRACEHFGNSFVVSRSSGSSADAQMMDLVGPTPIHLSNCASPTITTQASPTSHLTLGQAATVGDTATLHDANNATGDVTFTLYSDAACTVSTGISGTGTISSGSASFSHSFTPTAAGTYYWKASYPGDGNNDSFTTSCGDANEQIVVDKASPSITTQASPTTGTVGSAVSVSDTATFHNAFNPTGSVTFTLYSDNTCQTSTGVTGAGSISNGTASLTPQSFTPQTAGTYYWQASYVGDTNNDSFTTGCQDANEQLVVGKASPTITTQASPTTNITVGSTVTAGDTATFHNAVNPTGDVTFTLYSNNTCTTTAGLSGSGTISSGSATFSGSFNPQAVGTYYWKAGYAGDANNNGFTTGCNDANEQLTVVKASPNITTQAGPTAAIIVGSTVTASDAATFHNAFNPTGSVTFTLYSNNTCTTTAGLSGSGSIANGAASFSGSFTPQAIGTYYWQASYAGDANNNSVTTGCNDANEQLTVIKASPNITTQASPTTNIVVGSTVTAGDTATFHNAFQPSGDVTFTLYSDNQCTTSTGVSGTGTISNGAASFSHSFTPTAAGTYYWKASFAGDANNNGFTTSCNDDNEQLTVIKASPSITTQASPTTSITVGSTVTAGDTATFHNAVNPTGSVSFTLYSDNTCQTSTGVSGSGTISSGTASFSHAFTPSAVGTYYWQASYAGDANNNGFTTGCTDANEQLSVVKTTPTIATLLSATTGPVGASVHDSATLTGATSDAGGTAVYTVYKDITCQTPAVAGADIDNQPTSPVTVANGAVPNSPNVTFLKAGDYYWQIVYSGDSNNTGATSPCTANDNEHLSIGKNSPSITTTLSATSGAIGDTVHDSSTLHGATAGASGTATYRIYTNNTCSTLAVAGTDIDAQPAAVAVSGGSVADSPGVKFLRAGDFYWQVTYSGDGNNNGATSPCNVEDNEHLAIAKNHPTIATTLSATEIVKGSSVHDSATLTGATANAGGTVQYTVFGNDACSTGAQDAGTVTVQNGQVPNSNGVAFPNAGTFYWQAVYSGDANNDGATSACTEEKLQVDSPSITITKNPKSQSITTGDAANFTIQVTNTGTVTLTAVQVNDVLAPNCAKAIGTLAPGQSTSYTCALAAVQQSFTNSATATGHPPVGPDVTATDTAPVTVNQLPPPPPPPPAPPRIDLAITKVGTPNPTTVNKDITWTLTVVNNGPNNATGVTVADPIPAGTTYVSSTSTQGTCTGGAALQCQIGNLSVGQTVTITLVTTANQTGTIPNTATVVGNEAETNTANNTASASVNVVGVFKPPAVVCTAVAVSPKQLFVGRTNTLRMKLTQKGKATAGVKVRIKGSTISVITAPSNKNGLVTRKIKPMKAGIVTFTPIASKRCNAPRVGVIGVFTPPVTG